MERYICIHNHFYQPPRENPWLETIELQDSAYPYHDWNERITAECYAPNLTSRILDDRGRIASVVNNCEKTSFNFGPTLLSWMERHAPEVYQEILAADERSIETFSGHGNAIAQVYNHMILPLANTRDKRTQVSWGVRDFYHRFGRVPEGMWLSEAAVDLESLDILAEHGIRYTILSPYQASRVRAPGTEEWQDATGGRIDPTRAYLQKLPSGRTIAVFFYDGPISRAVAFEGLLSNGEAFAHRLVSGFSDHRDWPQLFHIATDGETYGHHHRHGEMALTYALHYIESNGLAKITNYGEYLEKHPPEWEVEIAENTAWSCAHGVQRWATNCGCNSGMHGGWHQNWREPLRAALDWLRDELAPRYEKAAAELMKDPWEARDHYIDVVLERSPGAIDRFFARVARRPLNEQERIRALRLLELQRHAMLMYTSCGWFFDELSGIETVQVIQYAGRAIQLASDLFNADLETRFVELLEKAPSNVPEHGNGGEIYRKWVKPTVVDLDKVAAHYAISSLFEDFDDETGIYGYTVHREDYHRFAAGRARLVLGRARVVSRVTLESQVFSFGVLHWGDHNITGGVHVYGGTDTYRQLMEQVLEPFNRVDLPAVLRLLDSSFGSNIYSLQLLFRDEQRRILNTILDSTLLEAEAVYRQVYEHHAPLMRFLSQLGGPMPKVFQTTAEFVLNAELRRDLEAEELNLDRITAHLNEAKAQKVSLDAQGLSYAMRVHFERLMARFSEDQTNFDLLERLNEAAALAQRLPFEVDISKIQNRYWTLLTDVYPHMAKGNDEIAEDWVRTFLQLGERLNIRVPESPREFPDHEDAEEQPEAAADSAGAPVADGAEPEPAIVAAGEAPPLDTPEVAPNAR